MNHTTDVFNRILENGRAEGLRGLKKVLLLYEEKISFIGDCCIRFGRFKYFRSFLNWPAVHINFTIRENQKFYDGLLTNNPHIDRISTFSWQEIDFSAYDAVFLIAYDETKFLQFLHQHYAATILDGSLHLLVFSISDLILKPQAGSRFIFPVQEELMACLKMPRPGELYISRHEQQMADQWLKEKGLGENEDLLIIIDSTTDRSKLLPINVYFDFLKTILERENVKILVFDEHGIGKQEFYHEWLKGRNMHKMIFAKSGGLRKDLCLLASSYTRLVFGPCTGLMHCASAIYNHFVIDGMDQSRVPLLVTYTGTYSKENIGAAFWWQNAPLVNCLLLKKRNGNKTMVMLHELDEEEKMRSDSLPCTEYTAQMLTEFVWKKLDQNKVLLSEQLTICS